MEALLFLMELVDKGGQLHHIPVVWYVLNVYPHFVFLVGSIDEHIYLTSLIDLTLR